MNTWQWWTLVIVWGVTGGIVWANISSQISKYRSRKALYFALGWGVTCTILGPLAYAVVGVWWFATQVMKRHNELREEERRNAGPGCAACNHPAGTHSPICGCRWIGEHADQTTRYCNCKWDGKTNIANIV